MSKKHLMDTKGNKACTKVKYSNRTFDFNYSNRKEVTCDRCREAIGKPYFRDSEESF